jgi:YbbR domain-containing protein
MRPWLTQNLGWKLSSVVLAFLLWAVVVGDQKVEVTMNVPLQVGPLPKNLVPLQEPPESVEVRLRGPKTLITTLTPREMGLENFPGNLVEGENLVAIRPEMIRVPRGIEVVGVAPRRIRLPLDAIAESEVEVSPRIEGVPLKGYILKRVTVTPPRVRLSGPRSEMSRLARLYTLPISLEGHSTSFSTRAMLEPLGRQIRALDEQPIVVAVEIGTQKS